MNTAHSVLPTYVAGNYSIKIKSIGYIVKEFNHLNYSALKYGYLICP